MQKILVLLLSLSCMQALAQDTVFLRKNKALRTVVTDRAPQAVFAEVFGRAAMASINYDRRFSKKLDGLGFTVGAGYFKIDGDEFYSFPVTLNYLLGKNGRYFEVGAGATVFNHNLATIDWGPDGTGSGPVMGTMTIGYRSQPVNGGFMFRVGINPLFIRNSFLPYYPYISFGYNF